MNPTAYANIVAYSISVGLDAEAKENFVSYWEKDLLRPVTKGNALQGWESLSFTSSEVETKKLLEADHFEAGVHGLCMGFALVDESGKEHLQCSCIIGVLERSFKQSEVRQRLLDERGVLGALTLKYFQTVFPKRFAALECD